MTSAHFAIRAHGFVLQLVEGPVEVHRRVGRDRLRVRDVDERCQDEHEQVGNPAGPQVRPTGVREKQSEDAAPDVTHGRTCEHRCRISQRS